MTTGSVILDGVSFIFLLTFFVEGDQKGIIVALFSFFGFLIGILAAFKFSGAVATFFSSHHIVTSGWSFIISFILVFLIAGWLVILGGRAIEKAIDAFSLGLLNNVVGGIIYVGMAVLCWSSILWLGTHAHFISRETMANSATYGTLSKFTPIVFSTIGEFLPMVKNLLGDVDVLFGKIKM